MRLAYISQAKIPSREAHSIQIMNSCAAFARLGCYISLFVPTTEEDNSTDTHSYYDVEVEFDIRRTDRRSILWWSPLITIVYYFETAMKARTSDFDIIYSRSTISCLFSALLGDNVVLESHMPVDAGPRGKWKSVFFKVLIRSSNFKHLIVITDSLKRYYESKYSINEDKITVARDAASACDANVEPVGVSEPSKLQVGYVGNLYKGKGVELIGEIAPKCLFAEFHVVGGKEEDVRYWTKLLSEQDNISFHGFVPPSSLDKYRLAFDVAIAPYKDEVHSAGGTDISRWMSPLKIFEYMASGCAIVASDLPAIREILMHDQTALLCSPNDANEWASSLEILYDNPELRKQLGQAAQEKYYQQHTWEKRTEKILSALND